MVSTPLVNDLKDLAILVGFIGTCAILLWRMSAVENRVTHLEDTLNEARDGIVPRINRLESRVFNGERK